MGSAGFARAGDSPAVLSATPAASAKPDFTLDDLNKTPLAISKLRGQAVLVHFFATWCEPCRDELASLSRLVDRADPARLRVLSISVGEVDIRVRNFVEKNPVNFSVLLDRDRSVSKSWDVSALPTTFILDRDLKPRFVVERDYEWDRLDPQTLVSDFSGIPKFSLVTAKPKTKSEGELE
jgi:peroxiredoxin